MSSSVTNPWLTAMGLPQWQLRVQASAVNPAAGNLPVIEHAVPKSVPEKAEPKEIVEPAKVSTVVVEAPVVDKPEPLEQPVKVAAAPAPPPAPLSDGKVVPLLVIWDELQEQAVAGAGSLPSGELGDLLANIVLAVGLTEDVVEAWSTSPGDIHASLRAKSLAPKSIWHFSTGQVATHERLQGGAEQSGIEMIKAPSLRELQARKSLKGQLWRLLKPLADAGLWR